MVNEPHHSASGRRTDTDAVEARAAFDRLNAALRDAGANFSLAGFTMVDDAGYPTFRLRMTSTQADVIAKLIDSHNEGR